MKLLRLLPVVLLLATLGITPTDQPTTQSATRPAAAPTGLPEAWFGQWSGPIRVVQPDGHAAAEFTMTLEIGPAPDQPAGSLPVYTWTIQYQMGENRDSREYLLRIATDTTGRPMPGHFVLDQRSGILVDQFLLGPMMQGHFETESGSGRNILHARYELVEEEGNRLMRVEIATYDGNETRRSQVGDGSVASRRLLRVQKGVLSHQ